MHLSIHLPDYIVIMIGTKCTLDFFSPNPNPEWYLFSPQSETIITHETAPEWSKTLDHMIQIKARPM